MIVKDKKILNKYKTYDAAYAEAIRQGDVEIWQRARGQNSYKDTECMIDADLCDWAQGSY